MKSFNKKRNKSNEGDCSFVDVSASPLARFLEFI